MAKFDTRVDVAWNASYATAASARTWTDVTAYVKTAEGIQITHARQDEFSQAGPNTCRLTLDNSDGRFTPGLASSPYYPNVKIGRPIRVCANLCRTGDNGTFEANATDWSGSNATVARTTAQAHSGSASLSVTAVATANMSVASSGNIATDAFPVVADTSYRASGWVRTAATGRSVDIRINWFDSGGALISTSDSANITDSTTWQFLSLAATSPSTAAYGRIQVVWLSATAGEVHYLDDVRLDYDRFVGYVDEWPLEWPGVVDTFATSPITASSRMARLGLTDKLRSVVEQEYLADGPSLYYTCAEAEGSTRVNDSSGNGGVPLVADTPYSSSSFVTVAPTFGSAIGPDTDGLTAVEFPWVSGTSNSQRLYGRPSGTLNAFEFFLSKTGSIVSDRTVFGAGILGGAQVSVLLGTSNTLAVNVNGTFLNYTGTISSTTKHIAVRQNGANVELWVNGVLDGSAAATLPSYDFVSVGDFNSPDSTTTMTVSHVALYSTAPTGARFLEHSNAGGDGHRNETAEARLLRYASYAGIPSAELSISTAADTRMAHIDTTGQGVVDLMQKVAVTDGGVLYDSPRGLLTYINREVRYNATATLTLNASASQVEAGYSPKLDRSALRNKVTATVSDGTYTVVAENTASVDEYGVHSDSDLELATTNNDDAHAAAWWRVNTYGEPSVRVPQLGVELSQRSAANQAEILAVKVSDKIDVNNLPSQSDQNDKSFFVEGYTETITDSLHRIEFNVSPTAGFEVWEVGHATYGQYDAYPISY